MGYELRKKIYLQRAAGKELRLDVMVREPGVLREKKSALAAVKSG